MKKIQINTDQFKGIEAGDVKDYDDLTPLQQFLVEEDYDCFEWVEEFEEGDWVVLEKSAQSSVNEGGDVGRITEIKECIVDGIKGPSGRIDDNSSGWEPFEYLRKATTEEIKEALVKEAKRRGLRKNSKIKSARTGDVYLWDRDAEIKYNGRTDELIASGAHGMGTVFRSAIVLYRKGQWAELVDQTPGIEVNGYTAEFHDDYVKFGCAKIDAGHIIHINEDLEMHNSPEVYSDTHPGYKWLNGVKIGEGVFSREQIKEIAEYYE